MNDTVYIVQDAVVKDICAKMPEPRAAALKTTFSMCQTLKTKPPNSESTTPKVTYNKANLSDNAVHT